MISRLTPRGGKDALRRRTYLMEATLFVVLASVALFLWTAPIRSERFLRGADLSQLEEASRREPNNPRVFYYKGLSLQQAGQTAPAHEAFGHAAQLNIDDERTWLAWAATAEDTSDRAEALGILEAFRQQHSNSVPIHLALARTYQQAQMPGRAYDTALATTRLSPSNAEAWYLAGTEAFTLREYGDAETAMRHAVVADPGDWNNQQGLGDALLEQRRSAEAADCFRKAVDLAPKEVLPRISLASALLNTAQGATDFDEVRRHLFAATALVPDLPPALLLIGKSYVRQARWAEAKPVLERAERLNPNNAVVHFELNRLYKNIGQESAAQREALLHNQALRYAAEKQCLIDRVRQKKDTDAYQTLAHLMTTHGETIEAAALDRMIVTHAAAGSLVPEQERPTGTNKDKKRP